MRMIRNRWVSRNGGKIAEDGSAWAVVLKETLVRL
jgi:hypothetical protein